MLMKNSRCQRLIILDKKTAVEINISKVAVHKVSGTTATATRKPPVNWIP